MKKETNTIRFITESGIIAALYAVLTLCFAPLSFGPVQLRISEALTVMPVLTAAGVPGLAVGCLVSNIIGVGMGITGPVDIIFGTIATLLAAIVTRLLRNTAKIGGVPTLSLLSPALFNALIVGAELSIFFGAGTFVYCALAVGIGELAVVCVAGTLLLLSLSRTKLYEKSPSGGVK